MTLKTHIKTVKPEERELASKREEQATLEVELAERELRSANLRAELGAFERRYLHFVGVRYAELDELKAQIAERLAKEHPGVGTVAAKCARGTGCRQRNKIDSWRKLQRRAGCVRILS